MPLPSVVRGLACVVVMLVSAARVAGEVWERMPDLPSGLAGFSAWDHDGAPRIAGGTSWVEGRKQWSDQVLELDDMKGVWRTVERLPASRAYGGSLATAGSVLLLGGHDEETASNRILRVTRAGGVEDAGRLPSAWRFARGTKMESRGYFVVREARDASWQGAFVRFDASTGKVRTLPPLPHGAWVLPAVCSANGVVIVAGGASLDPSGQLINHSAIMGFDPGTETWSRLNDLPIASRGMSAVALDGDRVFLAGGYANGGRFLSHGHILDARTGALSPAPALPLACMPELVHTGDWVYCIGGEDAPRSRSRKVYRAAIRDLIAPSE